MHSSLDTAPGEWEGSGRGGSLNASSSDIVYYHQVHHDKFSCGELVGQDCDMAKRFTGHKVTPSRMQRIHDAITEGKC